MGTPPRHDGIMIAVSKETMNLTQASKEWATRPADQRFTTIADLKAAVLSRRKRSRVVDVDASSVRAHVGSNGAILLNSAVTECAPTNWAFKQLAGIAKAPASYLTTLPRELAVNCLNEGLKNQDREKHKFMTVIDDGEDNDGVNMLQAVTSPSYGRIWDADLVCGVEKLVEISGGRFFNPKDWSGRPQGLYASDRDVFIFMIDGGSMVDGGGERDQLHRGFFAWNSEVGAKVLGLTSFLFRRCCGNHIVWGAQDVQELRIKHSSGAPDRFIEEAAPRLLEYVKASAKPVELSIRKAKAKRLIDIVPLTGKGFDADWQRTFGKAHGFSRTEVDEAIKFAQAEEGQCDNVWDIVQGFTAAARAIPFLDDRVDLETRAGKLIELI